MSEFVTVGEARKRLGGISKAKMAQLIQDGVLPTYPNALDKKSKLIKLSDIGKLIASGAVARRTKRDVLDTRGRE